MRFLSLTVEELLIHYLIYISPFLCFLNHCMQCLTLCEFLFLNDDSIWISDQLNICIKSQTASALRFTVNMQQWRHIVITINHCLLQGAECHIYRIFTEWKSQSLHATVNDDSDSDMYANDAEQNDVHASTAVHHMQTAHITVTNLIHYGNNTALDANEHLNDTLLTVYINVSHQWHDLISLSSILSDTACNWLSEGHTEFLNALSSLLQSHLHICCQLWKWSVIEQGLHQLFDSDAQICNTTQCDALQLVAHSDSETVIVLLTEGSKILLYVILFLLPEAQMTVIITSLIVLKQNLICHCMQWDIQYLMYSHSTDQEQHLYAVSSLIFVNIDVAVSLFFLTFLCELQCSDCLNCIVLNEAHLLLTAAHYHKNLRLLRVLWHISCLWVCMTVTLSSSAELELKQSLFLTQLIILHASSNCLNLKYQIWTLTHFTQLLISVTDQLVQKAVCVCWINLHSWQQSFISDLTAHSICYVHSKLVSTHLTEKLRCSFYNTDCSESQHEQILTA